MSKTNKVKFQIRYLELALRNNESFRVVDLTEALLVLKENKMLSGQNYLAILFLTGIFIWALTTEQTILIVVLIGLLWGICSLALVLYPTAVKRQIFIVDLNESVILFRTGAFDKLRKLGPLDVLSVSAEIDRFYYDSQEYYTTTFYMQTHDHRRNIVLQMNSRFLGDCEKFQKAMCRYFKNVCQIPDISMKKMGKQLSLTNLQ